MKYWKINEDVIIGQPAAPNKAAKEVTEKDFLENQSVIASEATQYLKDLSTALIDIKDARKKVLLKSFDEATVDAILG